MTGGTSRRTRARAFSLAIAAAAIVTAQLLGAGTATAQIPSTLDIGVEHQLLLDGLADPTALEVTPDGRVIFVQREGRVRIWKQDGTFVESAFLPVDSYDRTQGPQNGGAAECTRGEECPAGYYLSEGGIHGILLAPDFAETGHLYLYYTVVDSLGSPVTPPKMPGARGLDSTEGKFRLSRFTLVGDTLDLESEVPLFENPAEWHYCCHYGGDMEWLPDGTLLLSVGDDTSSDYSGGYSPHDPRPGWEHNNADLTSQNLADRRGKLLRIDVRDVDDNASMIPTDNPFLDVDGADPYVYAYGFRSDYRFAVNSETTHVYVGTVGPDARVPDPNRGPAAHDEIETVPPGGGSNHGWPRCIANNLPYMRYDFETGESLGAFDCSGMTPATYWYSYAPSPTSPYVQMGGGGNTAIGGVVYDRSTGALRLPESFDSTLLWMEFSRDQIWRSPIKTDGTIDNSPAGLVPLALPSPTLGLGGGSLRNPIDAAIGPDGAVYLMEYGTGTWNNLNGRLSRLQCTGCTPDPNDYGGSAVADPDAVIARASVADAGSVAGRARLPLVIAAVAGAMVLFRRRDVI